MHATFGAFTFDGATRELRCRGQLVHLSPKAFDLLAVLVRRRPSAVSKDDLHAELWPDTFVSDGNLAVLVAEIRRSLGDSAQHPAYLRTVSRFGYALTAAGASPVEAARAQPHDGPVCWLTWSGERARLKTGDNTIGRDPDADVCIDAVGMSRRHAVIHVGDDVATIRDLSSKNGTFADGRRITSPVTLADNAEVRLGVFCIRFRRTNTTAPTQTL